MPTSVTGWAPPAAAPGQPAPAGPADQRGADVAVPSGLSGVLQGFFWAMAALAAIACPLAFATLAAFDDYWEAPIGSVVELQALDDFVDVEDTMVAFQGLMWLAFVVVLVLMIVWMYLAHRATRRLWAGDRTWSSGWTIGGWFIPVANLLIPKLVLGEIERIAAAPRLAGAAKESWRRRSSSPLGWVWWVLMCAGIVTVVVGAVLLPDTLAEFSVDDVRASYVVRGIGFALVAASGVCGALHVRGIGKRLSPDAMTAV